MQGQQVTAAVTATQLQKSPLRRFAAVKFLPRGFAGFENYPAQREGRRPHHYLQGVITVSVISFSRRLTSPCHAPCARDETVAHAHVHL